jgi:hypothetical protein
MHGWSVRAFGEFEEALLWLSEGPAAEAKRRRVAGEKEIPVRFSERAAKPASRPPARTAQGRPRLATLQARAT